MSSIIISSDDFRIGKEVATKTAEVLGYTFIGTPFLADIAKKYKIPKEELNTSVGTDISYRELYFSSQETQLTFIRSAVLERLEKDNIVCQGLCAHLYVHDIPHILNVRVHSDPKKRMEKIASDKGVSLSKARKSVEKWEKEARRWSMMRFGVDEFNVSHYDMVLSLKEATMSKIVKTICDTIKDRKFQPMTYSRKCLRDLVLESKVRIALLNGYSDTQVKVNNGAVLLQIKGILANRKKKIAAIQKLAEKVPGVDYVEIRWSPTLFGSANS